MFRDEQTTSISGFIRKCIIKFFPTVKVRCFPNQKHWIHIEVCGMLKDRATTHRAVTANPEATAQDTNTYKKSRYDLRRAIKQSKGRCRNKVESYYTRLGRGYGP